MILQLYVIFWEILDVWATKAIADIMSSYGV